MSNENSVVGSVNRADGSLDRQSPGAGVASVDQGQAKSKVNLYDYFSDVQVVHLEKFPQRWLRFEERAKAVGVSGYKKFKAVLGDAANPPIWWRAGNGAWGCMMSHLHIVQNYLTRGDDGHLLVFEDDALFSEDFAQRLPEIMEEVGDDWDMLYFGGQHLHTHRHRPWKCKDNKNVINAYNVNRTHAFAVNKRFAVKYQQHIIHAPDYIDYNWVAHVDHQLGVLHEKGQYKIYAVTPWINGQAAGKSWTCGRETNDHWWQIEPKQIVHK